MLSKNRRASSYIAARIAAVICGNFAGSKVLRFQARQPSHCAPKPSNSARERGSSSKRFTCAFRTAGSCSFPLSASAISSSSGMVAHNRYDKRDAS